MILTTEHSFGDSMMLMIDEPIVDLTDDDGLEGGTGIQILTLFDSKHFHSTNSMILMSIIDTKLVPRA